MPEGFLPAPNGFLAGSDEGGTGIRSSRGSRGTAVSRSSRALYALRRGSTAVQRRINVLSLGVDDLERALRFYRDWLGFPTEGVVGTEFEHGAVAFFPLSGDLTLALYSRRNIAGDAQVAAGPMSPTEFTIGHNVNSAEEVDAVMAQALSAGARNAKPAGPPFWGGYAGYFQDPDGHLWEVAWNPHLRVGDAP